MFEKFGMSTKQFSQFGGAELLADKYKFTKEALRTALSTICVVWLAFLERESTGLTAVTVTAVLPVLLIVRRCGSLSGVLFLRCTLTLLRIMLQLARMSTNSALRPCSGLLPQPKLESSSRQRLHLTLSSYCTFRDFRILIFSST